MGRTGVLVGLGTTMLPLKKELICGAAHMPPTTSTARRPMATRAIPTVAQPVPLVCTRVAGRIAIEVGPQED